MDSDMKGECVGVNGDMGWKINKIKNITSDGIEERHQYNSGLVGQDENEGEPHPHLYLCPHAADAE